MLEQAPDEEITAGDSAQPRGSDPVLRRVLDDVAGFMAEGELMLLRRLAGQSHGTIVELGAFHGRSTIALCLGAQASGVEVITVDSFTPIGETLGLGADAPEEAVRELLAAFGFSERDIDAALRQSEAKLRQNLAGFGFAPRIISALSWEAATLVEGPIGLLFHDAGHTQEAVERALIAWDSKLADDAIVVFHDYDNEQWPEVQPTADAWAAARGWRKAEREYWLQAFRRGRS
jgi:hypothetical protein